MKETKLKVGGIWSCITAIVVTAMLCGTAISVSTQYSQTQKDTANMQAQAIKDSADKLSDGLSDISKGICLSGDRTYTGCEW